MSLVSLSLTPLRIDEILEVRREVDQVEIRGRAVLFESGVYAKMPDDIPAPLALAALDVAGAPAHVRAHIFLCMLAYYVEWHMREALAPLLFDDEELAADRTTRDPVAPARLSRSSHRKKTTRRSVDGLPVHSFTTLLKSLATQCRNRCRMASAPTGATLDQLTEPTPLQAKVSELIDAFPGSA